MVVGGDVGGRVLVVKLKFLPLIQDFLTPARKFDTGTAGGAGDKYEVWAK